MRPSERRDAALASSALCRQGGALRALMRALRAHSHSRSSGVRKAACAGLGASVRAMYRPSATVGRPSTTNSHCQPARPNSPSSASRLAAIGAPNTCVRHSSYTQISFFVVSQGQDAKRLVCFWGLRHAFSVCMDSTYCQGRSKTWERAVPAVIQEYAMPISFSV